MAGEMPIHVANERVKALSSLMFNLATALIAALAGKVYLDAAFTLTAAIWTVTAVVLIWMASQLLALLQVEIDP